MELKKTKCYIPVSVEQELPDKAGWHVVKEKGGFECIQLYYFDGVWYEMYNGDTSNPVNIQIEYWLKEQEQYTLTGEELKKLLEDAFNAGSDRGFEDGNDEGPFLNTPTMEEYITSLKIEE